MATGAELNYVTNASALTMANTIFGNGVQVVSASYTGPANSAATYSNGQLAPGVMPGTSGLILSTGNVRDFTQSNGDPNRAAGTSTDTTGTNNSAQFNTIAGTNTFDAVWLDVDFIPTNDDLTIRFVFSSEEYPEWINTQYNDVVGVWVNGNHVPIEVGNGRTSVNNINGTTQENLFRSNATDAYNTEMDGFTVTMTLKMKVLVGQVNSIRIGIADTGDTQYDSNLIIAADSVQSVLIAKNDAVELYPAETVVIDVLGNDEKVLGSTLTITQINGVNVVAGQTVTLASGQTVRLNADGTFTVVSDGQVEIKTFTYTVKDNLGNTDTAFVTINSIPCFVAGTLILTPDGEVPVERLIPGDLVMTHDDGPQPLRWTGRRTVAASGDFAPIRIRAGAFGPHRTLLVSPQHRILIRDSLAELLFGEREVLVAAKDLVNDRSIRPAEGGRVTYVHLLFDRHQVVFSEGLATESYLPGPQSADALEQATLDEIHALFPEIDFETGTGYGTAARRTLRPHEVQVLFAASRAA